MHSVSKSQRLAKEKTLKVVELSLDLLEGGFLDLNFSMRTKVTNTFPSGEKLSFTMVESEKNHELTLCAPNTFSGGIP